MPSFAVFLHTISWHVNPLRVEISGMEVGYGGILSLAVAAILAFVFYSILARMIETS